MSDSTTMLAAIYHEFGGPIIVERIKRPSCPEHDGVLLQVMATGVCRSDWHGWKGHDDDIKEHGLPFCPGHELSGIVVTSTSDKFQPGDRVAVPFILSCGDCVYCNVGTDSTSRSGSTCAGRNRPTLCLKQQQPGFTMLGSFAEYIALPRASRNLCKLPPDNAVSFVQAAALGCRFTTAYRAIVQQGQVSSKTTGSIGIFGCGGLGLSCIMIAAAVVSPGPCKIIAIDPSPAALEKARQLGATHTIRSITNEQVRHDILQLTDQIGCNVTVDAAGFQSASENAVHCACPGGRMVQVGLPIDTTAPPLIPMGRVAGKEIEIVGSHGFAASDLPALLQLVATGMLDPAKLVTKCVDLQEGAKTIEDMDKASPVGVIMITQFNKTMTSSRL